MNKDMQIKDCIINALYELIMIFIKDSQEYQYDQNKITVSFCVEEYRKPVGFVIDGA